MTEIVAPFAQFFDTSGAPLKNGAIYIGIANLDAQTNPIAVYWDEALTIPAPQPIRTLNGYPVWNGAPARLYVNAISYSITVQNAQGRVMYSLQNATSVPLISDSNGSSLVGFIASGFGAIARTAQAKMRDVVSVKDFGAVGDGVTDDTAAFQAAILAHECVDIPSGTYILSQKISVLNRGLTLKGAGTNATILKWTNSDGGIMATNSTVNENKYQISNMTFLTTQSNGGAAIYIDVANNKPEPSIRMSNLSIRGDNKLTQWWTIGIFANNGAVGFYENIYISGQEGVANAGTKGIYLGQDPGEGAMCHFLNQIDIKFCDYGFHVEMGGNLGIEGVVMTTSLIVQCNRCVWVDASTSTYVPPYFLFSGCQFDAVSSEALFMVKCAQIFVTDCVFYGYDISAIPLINLQQCVDFWINNCYFPDNNSPRTRTGIYCHGGTTRGYINACTFQELNEGIVMDATTSNIRVMPYMTFDNVATPYINSGASNITPDNFIVNSFGNNRVEILGRDGAIEIVRADGNPFIDLKSGIGEDADVRLQQISNGLRVFVGGNGALAIGLEVQSNRSVIMPGLPTSATGLPSGALWRDPADGNRIKGVP